MKELLKTISIATILLSYLMIVSLVFITFNPNNPPTPWMGTPDSIVSKGEGIFTLILISYVTFLFGQFSKSTRDEK